MSDDTMKPECLEQMVNALQSNSDYGICHCSLDVIDETGTPSSSGDAWGNWVKQQMFGDWLQTRHVRTAPHDTGAR